MVCCHKQLFCPFSTTDEEKDLEIQDKIRRVLITAEVENMFCHIFRRLNWVTAAHLECPFSETAPGIRDLIYQAINDILQVDGFKAPQDKLESVVSCAKTIFAVIQAGDKSVASADDFLPSLIFITTLIITNWGSIVLLQHLPSDYSDSHYSCSCMHG